MVLLVCLVLLQTTWADIYRREERGERKRGREEGGVYRALPFLCYIRHTIYIMIQNVLVCKILACNKVICKTLLCTMRVSLKGGTSWAV